MGESQRKGEGREDERAGGLEWVREGRGGVSTERDQGQVMSRRSDKSARAS